MAAPPSIIIPGSASIPPGYVVGRVDPNTGDQQLIDMTTLAGMLTSSGAMPGQSLPTPTSDGQLIIGKAGGIPSLATLTAGSGITVTNGGGSITIAASGGGGGAGGGLFNQVMSATPTSSSTGLSNWLNQGGASVADSATGVTITAPNSSSAVNIRGRYKTAPSTPYTVTALVALTPLTFGTFCDTGMGWYDGTNKIQFIEISQRNTSPSPLIFVIHQASPTTSGTVDFTPTVSTMSYLAWFRLKDDGTTVSFQYSHDGANFKTLYSIAKASGFLGSTGYSNIMFFTGAFNGDTFGTLMSYAEA